MYHFIDDKDFLRDMRCCCSDLVNQLVVRINNDSKLQVKAYLIGSGSRSLITQNEKEPIDLDFNLEITEFKDLKRDNGAKIKEYVRNEFNFILKRKKLPDCEDSTAVLTTKRFVLPGKTKTKISIDLAIVRRDKEGMHRLIHEKTGNVQKDKYFWNLAPDSDRLDSMVKKLKSHKIWEELPQRYLDKKNLYLKRNDNDHPSFIVYVETINEMYQALKGGKKK